MRSTKRFIRNASLILAVLIFAAFACACKGNNTPAVKEADVNKVYELLKATGLLPDLTAVPERDLFETYGIDSSKLKQWVFEMSENYSIDAGEVAIFEVNDESYVQELAEKLQKHLDRIKKVSKDYSPEQSSKLEKVEVKTVGTYVYMVVGENYEALMKVLKDNIG